MTGSYELEATGGDMSQQDVARRIVSLYIDLLTMTSVKRIIWAESYVSNEAPLTLNSNHLNVTALSSYGPFAESTLAHFTYLFRNVLPLKWSIR